MSNDEPDISPLANLERRFNKNPGLRTTPKAFDAIEDAAMREMELLKAKIWRLVGTRIAELEQDLAAEMERKK